jgi:hypothetical protein
MMNSKFVSLAAIVISCVSLAIQLGSGKIVPGKGDAEPLVVWPKASFDMPCLNVSKGTVNTFKSSDIEKANFCTPGGEPIWSVDVNDTGSWDFSMPWLDSKVIQHRLAFNRKKPSTSQTSFRIYSGSDVYFIVIPADRI